MDEVENPALPAAGEASPTIKPVPREDGAAVSEEAPPPQPSFKDTSQLLLETDEPPAEQQQQPQPPSSLPARPILKRESSAPPPPQPPPSVPAPVPAPIPPTQQQPPPPPPPASDFPSDPPDSLTLADLKRIRSTFPNAQVPAKEQLREGEKVYDFAYQDAQGFGVEVEEWFGYGEEEGRRLEGCCGVFREVWKDEEKEWVDAGEDVRRGVVEGLVGGLEDKDGEEGRRALMGLVYLGLGVWEETGGRKAFGKLEEMFEEMFTGGQEGGGRLWDYKSSSLQMKWIVRNVCLLHACGGLKAVYAVLQKTCQESFEESVSDPNVKSDGPPRRGDESMDLWCCLTLMYLFIEVARTAKGEEFRALKNDLVALEPNLLNYFTQVVAKLRWDDNAPIPLTKMLLLSWKTILVCIGGIGDIDAVKKSLKGDEEDEKDARGQPIITASPLDYHLFRQEISSKYPAYQPPPPLFPLEPENNSILPPLKHRRPSYANSETSSVSSAAAGTQSIMHQPVHIATPAPSPPPSPAGPGKAGKKQNYQTNQMFPFLYPPLDSSSNDLGGKGSTELQDALIGRKWEGSDIPTSILEAAELFAKRMRATRAMKQLWEARVDYMKFERGWKAEDGEERDAEDGFEILKESKPEETAEQGKPMPQTEEQRRLNAVNKFYEDSLPYLQSMVIVLLKAVLQNVTDLVTKGNGQNGLQAGIQLNEPNGVNGSAKPMENGVNHFDGIENTAEELDKLRSQEIAAKALSAILLLLLKWFKVSHILQYEYLTQLLLDSNYVPLILKLWQTQEIGRACHFKLDRDELNFFHWCKEHSSAAAAARDGKADTTNSTAVDDPSSEDEAMPPPIPRNRKRSSPFENISLSPTTSDPQHNHHTHPPEIDELGYPQSPLPSSPITSFSWRNVFTSINYLRVLQKITRRKTHRALLLVSYKSSTHLKKTLKIPVHELRYYTLKLFKSQVPFCGRKWRQGNMKIITAVWLSVPAELRDDWLSGGGGGMGGACVGDVDGTVEDALPLEQSLRGLTFWWNGRNYPDVMGVDKGLREEEQGFFERELEKMEVLRGEMVGEETVDEGGAEGMGPGGEGAGWAGPIEGY